MADISESPKRSIARNSLAELLSGLALLGFALVTGAVTARTLGPAGKGALAALLTIGDVFLFNICSLGLGEAAIVKAGQRRLNLQSALSSMIVPLGVASFVGAGVLLLISRLADWSGILTAVIIECGVLGVIVYLYQFIAILQGRELFVATSWIVGIKSAVTMVGTIAFVVVLDLGITGAVMGAAIGSALGLWIAIYRLRRSGFRFKVSWDPGWLRALLAVGIPIQSAHLLIVLSQRLDQLLVYALVGEAAGGQYAVALTVGQLVGFAPVALTAAAFPRIANAREEDVFPLLAQSSRVGLLCGLISAVVVASTLPFLIPLVFGIAFKAAIVPAWLLLLSGMLQTEQWILSRGAAARGRTGLKTKSYALNLAIMLALDAVLIPSYGPVGAALGSLGGSLGGLLLCIRHYHRNEGGGRNLRALVPTTQDLRTLIDFLKAIVVRSGGGSRTV